MKKNSLLKAILVTFFIYVLASWFINGGIFYQGSYYKADSSIVLGIGDIFSLPYQAFYLFAEYGVIFLIIGGFYGVLNQTGVLHKIVLKIASILKNKTFALIFISFLIMSFESIIGSSLLTFTLIPFFALILNEFGFKKHDIMFATVGSLLLGTFASTLGFNEFLNYLAEISKKSLLSVRLILFLVTFIILVVTLILKTKKNKEDEKLEFDYVEGTKKGILLFIILTFTLLIAIIGFYNFNDFLNVKVFNNFYTKTLAEIKFFNGMSPLGSWTTKDLAGLLLIISLIVSICYRIRPKELVSSFISGAKTMLKASILATLTGIIFMSYYNSQTGYNLIDTIVNFIYSSSSNYLSLKTALATPIYMILFNNPLFLASNMVPIIGNLTSNKEMITSSLLSLQMMNGITLLIIPTSYILIAGLAYFDISYGKWLKYIWKLILILLLITGIIVLM